jgi:uncharacterized membrane protein
MLTTVVGMRPLLLWVHLAGVVVWFGAVAYFLLVLRPAVRAAEMERGQWYLLLRQLKRRLRIVVGGALVAILISGVLLADARGLLRADLWSAGTTGRVFGVKMLLVAVLIVIYLTALPAIARLEPPLRRGKAFIQVHRVALLLGSVVAFLGLLLHG